MDYDENMGSWSHSVWLEVIKTRQHSKNRLLSIKDNYHLVRISLGILTNVVTWRIYV
jgi:hypothetical protein